MRDADTRAFATRKRGTRIAIRAVAGGCLQFNLGRDEIPAISSVRAILTYHSIDDSGSPISITPAQFRAHVEWLVSSAARVVPLDTLIGLPQSTNALALTFDDGFKNFVETAAPLLIEHALPATLFIVTDAVGRTNAWSAGADPGVPELPLLDWHELGRLAEGPISLGAHTRTHPRLSKLTDAAVFDEIAGSRERLRSETGCTPKSFAYPYGDVDERAAALVEAHFGIGCTTELRPLAGREDASRLPRLDTYYLRAPRRLESWGSRRFESMLRVRRYGRQLRQYIGRLRRS